MVRVSALIIVLSGCRLDVTAEATIGPDGSGSVAVVLAADPELTAELEALGVEPAAGLAEAAAATPGWQVTEDRTDTGASALTLRRDAAGPDDIAAAFRDLVAGLAEADPALLVDLDVVVDDGAGRIDGTAGLRPPATAGALVDGEPVGPSGAELAALVTETVRAQLVVTLPGPVRTHDADVLSGSTLTWELPVGATRTVHAASDPPAALQPSVLVAAAVAVLVLTGGMVTWRWARRRR